MVLLEAPIFHLYIGIVQILDLLLRRGTLLKNWILDESLSLHFPRQKIDPTTGKKGLITDEVYYYY